MQNQAMLMPLRELCTSDGQKKNEEKIDCLRRETQPITSYLQVFQQKTADF